MSYAIENELVPSGFFKGALADLSVEERQRELETYREEDWRSSDRVRLLALHLPKPTTTWGGIRPSERNPSTKASPSSSLRQALEGLRADELRRLARSLDHDVDLPRYKAEVVDLLATRLPGSTEGLFRDLAETDSKTIGLVERCIRGEVENVRADIPYLLPHVFTSGAGSWKEAFMPPEVRAAYAEADLRPLRARAIERERLLDFVAFHALVCGVVSMDDLYAHYAGLHENSPVGRHAFVECVKDQARLGTSIYYVHATADQDYVCHGRLDQSWNRSYYLEPHSRERPADGFRPWAMRDLLIKRAKEHSIRALELDEAQLEEAADVYGLPCVSDLTAFFDAHVPNGENGYEFADAMVDILLEGIMMRGASLSSVIWWLSRTGWYLAEGTNTAPRLTKLVFDLFREIPRWEFGGWSEREYCKRHGLPQIVSETCLAQEPPQDIDAVIPPSRIFRRTVFAPTYDDEHRIEPVPDRCYDDYPF